MSAQKIGTLVVYAVLALLAVTQAGTSVGMVVSWIIVILVAVHLLEMVVYFRLCQQADGSLMGNLLNVFVFGYFHMVEMKASLPQQ